MADSLDQAGHQFQLQINLTPDSPRGYNNLGVQRRNVYREAEAESLFARSIDVQPNFLAYHNLGQLHFREQAYAEAARMFEQARDLRPNEPANWKWLGFAYYWADGERAQAHPAWQRAITLAETQLAINPSDYVALTHLSEAYIMRGDEDEARRYLDRLRLHMRPNDFITKFNIARMYELLGDRDLALQYLTETLEDGFDPVIVERDPWLASLRTTPTYQNLRERFLDTVR